MCQISTSELDPPTHTRLFVTNSGKFQYVSDPYLEHYFANKMDHFQLKQLYGGGGQVGGNKKVWIFSKKKHWWDLEFLKLKAELKNGVIDYDVIKLS